MKKTMVLTILGGALCALILSCASSGGGAVSTWEWRVNGDGDNKGTSTIAMAEYKEGAKDAYKFTGNITNAYEYGFVNVKAMPDDATLENLKKAKAISFQVKGDGDPLIVKITTSDVLDYCYFQNQFDTLDGQVSTIIVPIEHFFQASWGKQIGDRLDTSKAQFVEWQTTRGGETRPYEFALWNLQVWTDKVPSITQAGGTRPKPAAAGAEAPAATAGGDFGAWALTLADNFEYGEGYQGKTSDKRLMNGSQVKAGNQYTLKITYTASRDLEDVISVGLVDTTPAASYWGPLTWGGDEETIIPGSKSKKGETVSATIHFTALKTSSGVNGAANALMFQTKGEGRAGNKNSGKQRAVTLNFTEFVFSEGHN